MVKKSNRSSENLKEEKASLPSPNEKTSFPTPSSSSTALKKAAHALAPPIPQQCDDDDMKHHQKRHSSKKTEPPTTKRTRGSDVLEKEKQEYITDLTGADPRNPNKVPSYNTLSTEDAAAFPPSLRVDRQVLPKPGVVRVGDSDDNDDDLEHQEISEGFSGRFSSAEPIEAQLVTRSTSHLEDEVERLSRLTKDLQHKRDSVVVMAEILKEDDDDDEGKNNNNSQHEQKRRLYMFLGCGLLVIVILCIALGVGLGLSRQTLPTPAPAYRFTFAQLGSNIIGENEFDRFGESLAISDDGTRIVVGTTYNDGNGIDSGHVRVLEWAANISDWKQVGSDIDGDGEGAFFGQCVDMNADGSTIIVGAPWPDDTGAFMPGFVRVYDWKGEDIGWQQRGETVLGEADGDLFGSSVAMSSDGMRIAIGAQENGANGPSSGHVRVYDWTGTRWEQAGADIDGTSSDDFFGYALAMNSNGTRIAVNYGGVERDAGHARVLDWEGDQWVQVGSDLDGEYAADYFADSLAMSADGNRIVVGVPGNDENFNNAGVVQVFEWNGNEWAQVGGKLYGRSAGDEFGDKVAMSANGNRIVVGARISDANGSDSGQVLVFDLSSNEWRQATGDIDGEEPLDEFGYSVAISSDGSRIAASAFYSSDGGIESGNVRVFAIEPAADRI